MIKIKEYGKGENAGVSVHIDAGTTGSVVLFGIASLIESLLSIDENSSFESIMFDIRSIIERDKNNESSSPKDSSRKKES